jgi:hypothetical protein
MPVVKYLILIDIYGFTFCGWFGLAAALQEVM